ncbi:hypothetical protein BDF22DRAFT_745325 [Syncephalis plumigaleata]|nr:hypothetical protein BDF22DRAFT_745325 [Syncephalis plumigaleata]
MVSESVVSSITSQDGGDDQLNYRNNSNMDNEIQSEPDTLLEDYPPFICAERVMTCEFCPLDAGQDLLAWGGISQLEVIRRSKKQKTNKNINSATSNGGRVVKIAWSPETECSISDKGESIVNIKLAVITNSQQIHIIINDEQSVHTIATVGEDHLCHLWSITAARGLQKVSTVSLSSPGVAVCWHPTDMGCLMVAERLGYIRLLDCSSWDSNTNNNNNVDDDDDDDDVKIRMHWRLTLTAPRHNGALTGADWKPQDRTMFGAVVGDRWYIWDLSDFKKLLPEQSGEAHSEGAADFRWSPAHPNLFATFTRSPKPFNAYVVTIHLIHKFSELTDVLSDMQTATI